MKSGLISRYQKLVIPVVLAITGVGVLSQMAIHRLSANVGECRIDWFRKANPKTKQIYPRKVVVRPWNGEHQVYGLFLVPDVYQPGLPVLLEIKGEKTACYRPAFLSQKAVDGIEAPPGFLVLRQHLRTKYAVSLILRYGIDYLSQPENWVLTYSQAPR